MEINKFYHKLYFRIIHYVALILAMCILFYSVGSFEIYGAPSFKCNNHASVAGHTRKRSNSKSRHNNKKRTKSHVNPIRILYQGDNGEWIHKGKRGIIISCDSSGVVRAMTPFTTNPKAGKGYAQIINEYSQLLQEDSVQVYSLIAPTQGEYYLPKIVATRGAEQNAIETTAGYLDETVKSVYVDSVFKCHLDEDIYNRTDHHWSPLGAYYASEAFAKAAGVKFLPISCYTPDTVKNYVGTMYKFSQDPAVKHHPEDFIWYMPPDGYKAEFIDYQLAHGHTVGESEMRVGPFFRQFSDGSSASYCTFMGGDSHTVKVSGTGGTLGRRLLIVKDSFGNAMASNLFGSFEEVHVIDFRYFPHNLIDYVRDNHITDLCFVNCISLAFAPSTISRLQVMLGKRELELAPIVDTEETDMEYGTPDGGEADDI